MNSLTSRRSFLVSALASGALAKSAPPNVLVILADEWRAQSTGSGGDSNVRTPALDRLAAESVSFENAIAGTPLCCPARACLMTGQYRLTNGVFINDVELKPKSTTLVEVFARAGYRTGYIGKWHLYGSPDGNYGRRLAYIPPNKRLGFDYWKACECSHDYNHSLYYEGNDPTPKYWPGYDSNSQTYDAAVSSRAKRRPSIHFFSSFRWDRRIFPMRLPLSHSVPSTRIGEPNCDRMCRAITRSRPRTSFAVTTRTWPRWMYAWNACSTR